MPRPRTIKEPGFFTMADSRHVLTLELAAAQAHCLQRIADKPGATIENRVAVTRVVNDAKSVQALSFAIANHALAHESKDFKVLR